jgi:signal transduction histidine kinase
LIDPDEAVAQVLGPDGRVLATGSATAGGPLLPPREVQTIDDPTFVTRLVPGIDADPLRLLAAPADSSQGRVVVVGATLGDRRDALGRLLATLLIGGPAALFVMSGAAWFVIGAALRPVERMRREAEAISASEPDRRLPVPPTHDEIARLGSTLNAMLDRLQAGLDRERSFVDDASHEIRTPLSVLKMELDLALTRSRTPEELSAALRSASGETDRLVRLAGDLLVLARMERGRVPVHRTSVSIHDLVEESLAAYADRARAAGTTIDVDVDEATVSVDPVRIRQAIENLLDNALRYAGRGGVVTVRARRSADGLEIRVEDSGPGFPDDTADRAFEPFMRSDGLVDGREPSQGAGLGLTIAQAVVEAHGGSARAENRPEGGARVSLFMPT